MTSCVGSDMLMDTSPMRPRSMENSVLYICAREKVSLRPSAENALNGIPFVTISIAIDTIAQVMLKTVEVVASKHLLGPHLIQSVDNRRLWGFTAGYRDGNASVQLPPDAHGNIDDGPAEDEGLGLPRGPVFSASMPWQVQMAYITGKLGSSLYSGPIWTLVPDIYHPAPDTTAIGN